MKISFIFLAILVFALCLNLSAETGQIQGSLGLSYGFDIEEPGLQLGGLYNINEEMRVGIDFIYWFHDYIDTMTEFNFNFHYLFMIEEDYNLYGVGSLGYHSWSHKYKEHYYYGGSHKASDSEIGIGIGGGFEYKLDPIRLYFEPRIFLSGFDQFIVNFGARYLF